MWDLTQPDMNLSPPSSLSLKMRFKVDPEGRSILKPLWEASSHRTIGAPQPSPGTSHLLTVCMGAWSQSGEEGHQLARRERISLLCITFHTWRWYGVSLSSTSGSQRVNKHVVIHAFVNVHFDTVIYNKKSIFSLPPCSWHRAPETLGWKLNDKRDKVSIVIHNKTLPTTPELMWIRWQESTQGWGWLPGLGTKQVTRGLGISALPLNSRELEELEVKLTTTGQRFNHHASVMKTP